MYGGYPHCGWNLHSISDLCNFQVLECQVFLLNTIYAKRAKMDRMLTIAPVVIPYAWMDRMLLIAPVVIPRPSYMLLLYSNRSTQSSTLVLWLMRSLRPDMHHYFQTPDFLLFFNCRLPSTCKETCYFYLPAAASGGGGGATPACVPRCVVALTACTSSRRSSVSLVLVRVIICILRRSDGSLVVCQDTDSHYSLIRVHRPGWPVIQGPARCRHLWYLTLVNRIF